MSRPTKLEGRIANLILAEIKEKNLVLRGWEGGYVQNLFPQIAEWEDEEAAEDRAPRMHNGGFLTAKQHCAFWLIVTGFKWECLKTEEMQVLVQTVGQVMDSTQEKYESRWMEHEMKSLRDNLKNTLEGIAKRRQELLDSLEPQTPNIQRRKEQ
jgi:hypothetical protein